VGHGDWSGMLAGTIHEVYESGTVPDDAPMMDSPRELDLLLYFIDGPKLFDPLLRNASDDPALKEVMIRPLLCFRAAKYAHIPDETHTAKEHGRIAGIENGQARL
jgi:hypothetical protein